MLPWSDFLLICSVGLSSFGGNQCEKFPDNLLAGFDFEYGSNSRFRTVTRCVASCGCLRWTRCDCHRSYYDWSNCTGYVVISPHHFTNNV